MIGGALERRTPERFGLIMKQSRKSAVLFCAVIVLVLVFVSGCKASSAASPSAASPSATRSSEMADASYGGDLGGMNNYDYTLKKEEAEAGGVPVRDDMSDSAEAPQAQQATGTGLPVNRKIIKTVNINMETLTFDTLVDSLTVKTGEFGGYVESSSVSGLGINQYKEEYYAPRRYAYVVMRIPTQRLDEFTSLVGTLGNVTQKDQSSEDITLNYADTEARRDALTVEYERLMTLLEKAESLDAVVALEARLSDVRYQLDSLGSALRRYDSLVDFSTVTVSVQEVQRLTPTPEAESIPTRISTGFQETLLDIRDGAGDFMVWFVVNLPYLLFWAAVVVAAVLVIRRAVKKVKMKHTAALPGFPPQPPVQSPASENTPPKN